MKETMVVPSANSNKSTEAMPSVLVVHNKYRRIGGEDTVVENEIGLLTTLGGSVETMIYDSLDDAKISHLMRWPLRVVFNQQTYDEMRALIRRHKTQVVHCHNLFPLLSTSIYRAARAEGVPVIQTVHNYRMGCLNGLHLRDNVICEQCRPGHHLDGIIHGCYRQSRVQSVAFGFTQAINYWSRMWDQPTLYIAPTQFLKEKLQAWGIPEQKIVVKPHFVWPDPGRNTLPGEYALFVGRLAPEKGLDLLLDVWHRDRLPLRIVGDGPLRPHLEQRVHKEGRTNVSFAGYQDRRGVDQFLRNARFLVMPSIWFEIFGLVVIEAYAHGVPVIAPRLGAMADVVQDGTSGLLFQVNNREDLAVALSRLETQPHELAALRDGARKAFESSFSARSNAQQLRSIYLQASGQSVQQL